MKDYEKLLKDYQEAGLEPTPEDRVVIAEIKRKEEGEAIQEYKRKAVQLALPKRYQKHLPDSDKEFKDLGETSQFLSGVSIIHGKRAVEFSVQLSAQLLWDSQRDGFFAYLRDVSSEFSHNIAFSKKEFREMLSSHFLFLTVCYKDDFKCSEMDYFFRKRFDQEKPTILIAEDLGVIDAELPMMKNAFRKEVN